MGVRRARRLPRLAASAVTLAHLHVDGCPCSRCSVARNYARLRATVADTDESDAAQAVAAEQVVALFETCAADLDTVAHG